MAMYEHDVLDEKYDVDKHYIFLNGETCINTRNGVVSLEAGFLQTKQNAFYGRTTNGKEVVIPVSDVISIEGGI